jgi:ribosomal protein S18 acetylase RimI-like enzyme
VDAAAQWQDGCVARGLRLRPFDFAADRRSVEALWRAALHSGWPLLPGAIAMLGEGFVAVDGQRPVGLAAVDVAGSIPLVLVAPGHQRRGIGAALLGAALRRLAVAGVREAHAGSGGRDYIWPGVPLDLPAAVRFFAAGGWRADDDSLDLAADLSSYRPPADVYEPVARAGVAIVPAAGSESGAALAFETATFPSWARWFQIGSHRMLIASESSGKIVGTLLFQGPGANTIYAPMLGPQAGTISCVGVAPDMQGRGIGSAMVARASEILRDNGTRTCHIGWTGRESFYIRAGYRPWRRYRMFHRATGKPTKLQPNSARQ